VTLAISAGGLGIAALELRSPDGAFTPIGWCLVLFCSVGALALVRDGFSKEAKSYPRWLSLALALLWIGFLMLALTAEPGALV